MAYLFLPPARPSLGRGGGLWPAAGAACGRLAPPFKLNDLTYHFQALIQIVAACEVVCTCCIICCSCGIVGVLYFCHTEPKRPVHLLGARGDNVVVSRVARIVMKATRALARKACLFFSASTARWNDIGKSGLIACEARMDLRRCRDGAKGRMDTWDVTYSDNLRTRNELL